MSQPSAAGSATSAPYWQARTGSGLHPDLLAYSQTVDEDRPFVIHDLAGSSAHVLGLHKARLISRDDAAALLAGLRRLLAAHEAGTFALDVQLEDAHMNIEARLTAELGDVGRRVHSGRSRNDQVATCIVLYARDQLADIAQAANTLAAALAGMARAHARTAWVARTHGQAAQPASLGFLLAAHAHRFQDLARKAIAAFEAVGESPLGCGAVAGTTLPLDPAFTARLMGLRPPRNAILATGTRDAVLESCALAAHAGIVCAGLAQDLLDLFAAGALRLPEGFTTGSSLMPHKRNPDALELARGRGKSLLAPYVAAHGILAGMGLGYQRDFQLTKPHLVAALEGARTTIEILTGALQGATVDAKTLASDLGKPGVVATDVAEALVRAGIPFRTAYATVAQAFALVEKGTPFDQALARQGLEPHLLEAAVAALHPDPARRVALGGPAPETVLASLDAFDARGRDLSNFVAFASASVDRDEDWQSTAPRVYVQDTNLSHS
ncbi:MAG: argininosuccinate lyase, partial [Thermoplasmatota archaeon]